MCRKPVVDLLDAARLRMKRGRGNRPVCCNMGGVRVRDLFEILQRPGGLCRRRTEGIVRQWIVRIVTRLRDDVIGDILCL